MNNLSPSDSSRAYEQMLREAALATAIDETPIAEEQLTEGWTISVSNFKGAIKDIEQTQERLDKAEAEYYADDSHQGTGTGHYQQRTAIAGMHDKQKKNYKALIEIQNGLLEKGEMTKALQKQYIEVLEPHVNKYEKRASARTDNNFAVKAQLATKKAELAKAKSDLSDLK